MNKKPTEADRKIAISEFKYVLFGFVIFFFSFIFPLYVGLNNPLPENFSLTNLEISLLILFIISYSILVSSKFNVRYPKFKYKLSLILLIPFVVFFSIYLRTNNFVIGYVSCGFLFLSFGFFILDKYRLGG